MEIPPAIPWSGDDLDRRGSVVTALKLSMAATRVPTIATNGLASAAMASLLSRNQSSISGAVRPVASAGQFPHFSAYPPHFGRHLPAVLDRLDRPLG
jgi:hypothetical protein